MATFPDIELSSPGSDFDISLSTSSGWSLSVNGVSAANIAKINGIAVSSISKINSISGE